MIDKNYFIEAIAVWVRFVWKCDSLRCFLDARMDECQFAVLIGVGLSMRF
jgi:hypothetical protein